MILPNSGLENHPDGTGQINAIVNGNWNAVQAMFNPGEGATLRQDNGTPGNSGTTLTCNKPVFRTGTEFVGAICRFADGSIAAIASVSSTTVAVATTSADVPVQAFEVYLTSQEQYDALARGLVKQLSFASGDTGKAPLWDQTLGRFVLSFAGGAGVVAGRILYGGGTSNPPASSADLTWDDSTKLLTVTGSKRTTKVDYSDFSVVNSATGSQTPDFGLANNHRYNVVGNITINAPTNVKVGATYRIVVQQDGTGGWAVTWNSVFKNATLNPVGTGANAYQEATFIAAATNELVCCTGGPSINYNLFGAADPSADPPDVNQTWQYLNTTAVTLWWWIAGGSSWTQVV